jgi:hypothetical protein
VRGFYMRRLFGDFSVLRQLTRSIAPILPSAALILAARVLGPDDRTFALAMAELVAYGVAVVLFTWLFERRLLTELAGYLRRRAAPRPVTA